MNNHAIRIARLTDGQIVDLIIAIQETHGFDSATIRFGAGAMTEINPQSMEQFVAQYGGTIHTMVSLDLYSKEHNLIVSYRRGICQDSDRIEDSRQASPYFDEIFLRQLDTSKITRPNTIIAFVKTISESLQEIPRTLEGNQQDVISLLRAEISALSETYRKMLKEQSYERTKLLNGIEKQRLDIEKEREVRLKEIKDEARNNRREHEDKMKLEEDRISKKQLELDAREQELDDRHHMHVRRELREKIIEEVKRRSGVPVVSRRAAMMRWTVFLITLSAGIGLTGFALWTFYLLASTEFPQASYWLLLTRASILSVAGLGSFYYAIRWLRNIYLDDVRISRHYENYRDDIDRASFAIETIMEISGEKEGVAVPQAWIDGVCRNLFRSDVADHGTGGHDSDALVELLQSISGASFGPNGSEVRLDRRGAKRLANRLSADKGH